MLYQRRRCQRAAQRNAGQVGSLLHQQVDTVPNDCRFIRLASFAPGIGYNAILTPVTFDKFNLLIC